MAGRLPQRFHATVHSRNEAVAQPREPDHVELAVDIHVLEKSLEDRDSQPTLTEHSPRDRDGGGRGLYASDLASHAGERDRISAGAGSDDQHAIRGSDKLRDDLGLPREESQ